jgi:hypothetical protein
MAGQSFLQLRRFAPTLLVGLWSFGIGYLAATSYHDEAPYLRHRAVVTSAEMVVALMVSGWALMIVSPTGVTLARLVWTLGVVTLFIHIVLAFWLAHDWSHDSAVERVREVGGFGGGIVASYLFALVWLCDVAWWWINPGSYAKRQRWIVWSIHVYLAFIVLNAAVVFVPLERGLVYGVMFVVLGILVLIRRGKGTHEQ